MVKRKDAKAKPAAKRPTRTRRRKRGARSDSGNRTPESERRSLVDKVKRALGPDQERWAEEIAAVLIETTKELREQQSALQHDPRERKEMVEAVNRLTKFHEFWKAHPRIHEHVPRDDPKQSRPVSAEIADLLRRLRAAVERLPETKTGDGSEEMARRWLGFAVVSALKSRNIKISRFENGAAVLTLETACALLRLPRMERKRLAQYIRTGTKWFGDLR